MTMETSEMNQELATVDKSKIAALQQKRTLAFVNHFVITNVQFLNNFLGICERKLMQFERKLEKVNAAMVLLESKLSSIPELDIPRAPEHIENKIETIIQENTTQENDKSDTVESVEKCKETKETRPEYERFIKMVQVGVPLQAVKIKVSLEGLDPNIFESILNK